jgi:hypothetical protein
MSLLRSFGICGRRRAINIALLTELQDLHGWIKYLAVDAKQVYFTDIPKVYALPK